MRGPGCGESLYGTVPEKTLHSHAQGTAILTEPGSQTDFYPPETARRSAVPAEISLNSARAALVHQEQVSELQAFAVPRHRAGCARRSAVPAEISLNSARAALVHQEQ